MIKQQLVLGSTSKPRQLLLQRLHLPFEIAAPNVDETPHMDEAPSELVIRLAEAKARKVAEQFPEAFIIGADQVGILENEILCKPMAHANAIIQLQKMSGRVIEFFIGLCLFDAKTQTQQLALEKFSVTMKKLSVQMIENYLEKEFVLHCAGSFKAEGLGIALASEFHGQDFTALIGLPLLRLTTMLENVGLGPLS